MTLAMLLSGLAFAAFPSGDHDPTLRLEERDGKLVVDGHVTAARWKGQQPLAFPVGDGRMLLFDNYDSYHLWLWEPKGAVLTDLGVGIIENDPGVGLAIWRSEGEIPQLCDIDPVKPALRPLWTSPVTAGVDVVGLDRGVPVVAIRDYQKPDEARLFWVHEGKPAEEKTYALHDEMLVDGSAVRDGFALLRRQNDKEAWWPGSKVLAADLSVLDLATGQIRRIGAGVGAYTDYTAVPHPYVNVAWTDRPIDTIGHGTFGMGPCMNVVDPVTFAITVRDCPVTWGASNGR